MKKRLAYFLGITENLAFAAGNVAISLNKYVRDADYDIVIYYTHLLEHDIQALKKIPHVQLYPFKFPEEFIKCMLAQLPSRSRFKSSNALMCFSHFEVFALLDKYRYVVWLDADTSIQRDISSIVEFAPFGITADYPWKVRDQFTQEIAGYDMNQDGVCTAVMIVGDQLPYKKIYRYLYRKAIQWAKYIINPDQAIMSMMLQDFHIVPKLMNLDEWQCIAWKDEGIIARIVHFGTAQKAWNNTNICNAYPQWYRTHLEWLELGGSDFNQLKITPRSTVGTLNAFDEKSRRKEIFRYYLLGVLPIWKIKMTERKTWHYLFTFLPIIKVKQ